MMYIAGTFGSLAAIAISIDHIEQLRMIFFLNLARAAGRQQNIGARKIRDQRHEEPYRQGYRDAEESPSEIRPCRPRTVSRVFGIGRMRRPGEVRLSDEEPERGKQQGHRNHHDHRFALVSSNPVPTCWSVYLT